MALLSQVSIRELKNQATAVLRRVEAGERVVVTKRGRIVATIEPAADGAIRPADSLYRRLQRHIEAPQPGLQRKSAAARRRDFEQISRKIARLNLHKDWRAMDRVAKGDRFGLSR